MRGYLPCSVAVGYDPLLGRFTSPDSFVPDAGSVIGYNRYAYVSNNPMIYTDPSGHNQDGGIGDPDFLKLKPITYSWEFIIPSGPQPDDTVISTNHSGSGNSDDSERKRESSDSIPTDAIIIPPLGEDLARALNACDVFIGLSTAYYGLIIGIGDAISSATIVGPISITVIGGVFLAADLESIGYIKDQIHEASDAGKNPYIWYEDPVTIVVYVEGDTIIQQNCEFFTPWASNYAAWLVSEFGE